jgi:adenosylcobinamide kinase/adenosylcobinamide-phosphate guanylyltransferase
MQVLLLGTGAADGWPNPWCQCNSCSWARSTGQVRTHSAALVDGSLLIDCGPEVPRQADRAGVGLAGVTTILLTHAHPDHVGPMALLWRSWAKRTEPLQILGPSSALDLCRDWIGPADPVTLTPLQAGEEIHVGDHTIQVLAAAHAGSAQDILTADAVLYDVTGPDGARLLYASDTGPLPRSTREAISGRAYDIVLLELTFGGRTDHGTGHLDFTTFPAAVAEMRRTGAITADTDVVAVHLGHNNPAEPELSRRLAMWGARAVPDLTLLTAGEAATASPEHCPHRALILGGARSGKSAEAERRLAATTAVTYVATGGQRDGDAEWAARVALHRARRPLSWQTVETAAPGDAIKLISGLDHRAALLVDCISLWLTGVLDAAGSWEHDLGTPGYRNAATAVRTRTDELVEAVHGCRGRLILVSNEVGSSIVPEHASGRLFQDQLGTLNSRLAAVCDEVTLVVAGRPLQL